MNFQTSFCGVILSRHSKSGQKVSNPNARKEQSFEVLLDGHIKATDESKTIRNSCMDRFEQCWQQCKNTHTHNTDHLETTHRRDGLSDMQRGTFLVSEVAKHSLTFYRAMGGPYRGKLVEFGETVLAHLQEVGKGSGNPAPKLADRWKSGVWLGKSDLTDEHLVRTDDGVVYAGSVRRLAENGWSEENLKAVVETPQKPRSMTTDDAADPRVVPEVHEQENPNESANENDDESGETPDKPDDENHEMEGETLPEPDTAATSSSSGGEKRKETQENVFVKRRLLTKSPM